MTIERLFRGAALIAPPLAVMAPLGLAPGLALFAVVLLASRPSLLWQSAIPLRPFAVLLALLAVWGGASALWSTIPGHSLLEAVRFLVISAEGLVVVAAARALPGKAQGRLAVAMLVGLALGLAILAAEAYGGLPLHRALYVRSTSYAILDRGEIVISLLCWPAIIHLATRHRIAAAMLVWAVTLLALLPLESLAAVIGLAASAAAFLAALFGPRLVAFALGGGFAVLDFFLPLWRPGGDVVQRLQALAPWLRRSGLHRLAIWRFAGDRIAEHPWLGWGMDAARAMPGGNTAVKTYLGLPPNFPLDGVVMPLHPHDAILQLWMELGPAGVAIGSALLILLLHRAVIAVKGGLAAAGFLAIIAAALPPLLLSFGVWQAWWQSSLWLTAAFAIALSDRQPRRAGDHEFDDAAA